MIEELIKNTLFNLRNVAPLVLSLTNYVSMDFMANSLLALGAKPLMSQCEDELEELIQISHAVNINIGTLDEGHIARCKKAVILAKKYNKPLILDPVGSGASAIRTQTARELMKGADIIRGNASEIISLMSNDAKTSGVDSGDKVIAAESSALIIGKSLNVTVAVSGVEDFITDGKSTKHNVYGSSIMPLVTGMGCTLNVVIAAFRAVLPNSFEATKIALAYFGMCAKYAESYSKNPGSFRTAFIDALHTATFLYKS